MTTLLLILLTAVLHEAGHVLTACAFGLKIKAVGINRRGRPYSRMEPGTAEQNCLISLGGPLLNFFLALVFWRTGFGLFNLVFGLVNLLPIRGSDGWRVSRIWSQEAAMRRILGR